MIKKIQEPKKILCIYHGNCADGFTGAWVINQWAKEHGHIVEFYPGVHGEKYPPIKIKMRHVIFVDFSYDKNTMIEMSKTSASITVLDHHKTAEANMVDLERLMFCPSEIIFDMSKSGCKLAWDYFFPNSTSPLVLDAVEDRDLWKFKYNHTKEISSAVFSYEYTFENWDYLMNDDNYKNIIQSGKAIEKKHTKDMLELYEGTLVWRDIEVNGKRHVIPTFNVAYFHSSELGNHAMKTLQGYVPFALCWYINKKDEYKYSLRSIDDREDVSEIAKAFGGGGHRNSAGCSSKEPIWL